jgi:hypothetical protein
MPYDELLRLTGTTNNPLETITATGNGAAVYAGADRMLQAELRVAGAVSGTTPTLDIKFQSSVDGVSSFTDLGAAFPQRTTSDISGGGAVPGTGPNRLTFNVPTGRPYVRIVKTVGGTTPSFGAVSVLLQAPHGGVAIG